MDEPPMTLVSDQPKWYVMRDLKRANAKHPAYKILGEKNMKIFTPMVWKLSVKQGKRIREKVPFMADLLFVYDTRHTLDPLVELISTFQYRYMRGSHGAPMTVRNADMERFIKAVEATENPYFYTPGELTPDMIGRNVRIIGGALNNYEGRLQKIRGSRSRRLLVELPNLLTVSVEVSPEYIQLL